MILANNLQMMCLLMQVIARMFCNSGIIIIEGLLSVVFATDLVLGYELQEITNGSKILFPNTQESQEIPLEVIRRLNLLSSVEEFFSNSVVDSEQSDLTDRMGLEAVERRSFPSARTGKCMPEFTTISLKPNHTTTTFYYPRCARVKRCGGCCLHDLFSCQPIESEIVSVTVAIAVYIGGHEFRLKERKTTQIEQHTKCECRCKVQPQDCTKYQTYNAENCRCECPNSERERKCFKKLWNPDICSCVCRDELTCGTGFEFDPFTCSCVASRNRKKTGFIYRLYV